MSAASPEQLAARIAEKDFALLRTRLLADAPEFKVHPARSDYDFNPEFRRRAGEVQLTPAAVLMPIVAKPVPTVLFTQRTANLTRHAGQVSFPGGRVDPTDETALATALRETHEETGITSDFVTVAGFMEGYETGTGFAILPVVGVLREGFTLMPNPAEVNEIFEVPLAFLLDPKNRERQSREWQGQKREFYAFNYGSHYIWGATAAILVNFAERFAGL
ncbi:MAG TPA: CoA pyrophosphatase [Rhizomicrobium sp.]|jgi:8-oxo-dGTP pyrophosphatase MutT (NUDIX family)